MAWLEAAERGLHRCRYVRGLSRPRPSPPPVSWSRRPRW